MLTTETYPETPMLSDYQKSDRAEFINGLRDLANWYGEHPDLEAPGAYGGFNIYTQSPEHFAELRRILGVSEKQSVTDTIYFRKSFGSYVKLDININKEKTCEKVKVGTRIVPAQPERVEEVYEWKCAPILEAAEATA